MATKFARAAGGTWTTDATWSTTTGGGADTTAPTSSDVARLDSASGSVTTASGAVCSDLNCTGYTATLTNSATTVLSGSLTLSAGMTLGGTSRMTYAGTSSHTITTAGKTIPWQTFIDTATGTYTLAGALTSSNNSGVAFYVNAGSFNDAGFAMTFTNAAAACAVFAGPFTLSGTFTTASTAAQPLVVLGAFTVNHTGTIVLSAATASAREIAGGGKTYGTLTDSNTGAGVLTVTGDNTFGTINKTATVACGLTLPTATSTTVTNFNVNGVAGQLLSLVGDIDKASGTVSCDYLSISNSDATGGAAFYAGTHSTNGGTNTGWVFTAPPNTGSVGDSAGRSLNRLAGTTGLDAQGAANRWAGTTGLDLVGALNAKAGTTGLEYNGVCRRLASQLGGRSDLDAQAALASIP